jgi:hypothetical protein
VALGHGVDVNWETGEPMSPPARPQGRDQQRNEQRYQRAITLRAALADETGHAITEKILDTLATRLIFLANADAECQAYLSLLQHIGQEVVLGRHAAAALMHEVAGFRPDDPIP